MKLTKRTVRRSLPVVFAAIICVGLFIGPVKYGGHMPVGVGVFSAFIVALGIVGLVSPVITFAVDWWMALDDE